MLTNRITKDVDRRRIDRLNYFNRAVGAYIRRRRKELNLTQESLAKGICSNTYVSKMETNSIAVNRENLELIMERMDMSYELGMDVDEQITLFERALGAFVDGDYAELDRVAYDVRNVEFAVLTELCKLVRDIVACDQKGILEKTDNLSRYLESMDHYAFGVFMFYAAAGMLVVGRPLDALDILAELERTEYAFLRLAPAIEYMKASGNVRTGRWLEASTAIRLAEDHYLRDMNFRRLGELAVIRLEAAATSGQAVPKAENASLLATLDDRFQNRYRHLRVIAGIEPDAEAARIPVTSPCRRPALFTAGRAAFERGDGETYAKTLATLKNESSPADPLDYARWLELIGAGDDVAEKEFLIAAVLPHAEATADLPLLRRTTARIARILSSHKRYKDAYQYEEKLGRYERRLQRIAWADVPEEPLGDAGSDVE